VFKAYDYASGPVFGRDGAHWAFRVGKREGKDRERWWVLLDGKEVGAEDWIGDISLAPDGEHYAAWTQPGAKLASDGSYTRGKQVLVTPWKSGAKWDDADSLIAPRFALDGSFVTTLASKAGKWQLLLADKNGEHELGVAQAFITGYDVSQDGKSFALMVADDSTMDEDSPAPPDPSGMADMKSVIVFGKQTLGADRDDANSPRISPDAKQVAWILRSGAKHGVAFGDGKRAKASHDWVRALTYRPDGKELAFAAGTGGKPNLALLDPEGGQQIDDAQWHIVRCDSGGKEHADEATFRRVAHLTWSRDSKQLAFAGETADGWRIICGDKRSEPFDEIGPPHFSADGTHVAFGARKGRELWWKIL
jgi:hypothetical protein